ncbi:MAG: queuosine precursor transporter [Polyangiaceae bacterium]|nr:queuosine precursor transporter [Polyangiaceae bacterium]
MTISATPAVARPATHAADAPAFATFGTSQKLFLYLAAIFVACLLLGDVIGGKIIQTPAGPISVGIIPFPITFLLTDIVNDFYGRRGAHFLTMLGFFMSLLAWVFLQLTTLMPADPSTYFTQAEFAKVFGGSAQLFVASMAAYMVGQFLDIAVFHFWKAFTQSRHLWLRSTGSTIVSQAIDTITINIIFGRVTAGWTWGFIGAKVGREYVIKFFVAVALTPAIYALHEAIVRGLRIEPEAHEAKRGPATP